MKNSMNKSRGITAKEKVAHVVGRIAEGMAQASSDKCFFMYFYEPKMPKSLFKRDK